MGYQALQEKHLILRGQHRAQRLILKELEKPSSVAQEQRILELTTLKDQMAQKVAESQLEIQRLEDENEQLSLASGVGYKDMMHRLERQMKISDDTNSQLANALLETASTLISE